MLLLYTCIWFINKQTYEKFTYDINFHKGKTLFGVSQEQSEFKYYN